MEEQSLTTKQVNKAKKWLWLINQLPANMRSYCDTNVYVRRTRIYLKSI